MPPPFARSGLVVLLASAAGCNDIPMCPEENLEVTVYDGAEVTRTWVDCEGDGYFHSFCSNELFAWRSSARQCGGTAIVLSPSAVGAPAFSFEVSADGSIAGARVDLRSEEDGEGSAYDAQSGWLQVSEGEMDRVYGAFEAHFSDIVMRGTFDTAYDPYDDL